MQLLLLVLSDYISIYELQTKYDITITKNIETGIIKISSVNHSLTLAAGFNVVGLDKTAIKIAKAPSILNGELVIPNELFNLIDSNFPKKTEPVIPKVTPTIPKLTVLIDPGHGGNHRGTQGHNGTLEKDLNLNVSLMLKKELTAKNYQVFLTRETDTHLSKILKEDLSLRVEMTKEVKPDFFISIHANWIEKSDVRGFEIYMSREGRFKSESLKFAKILQGLFGNTLDTPDRGIKEAGFFVLKHAPCPALLLELDYLSNRKSEMNLATQSYREKIVKAITQAFDEYAK